MMKDEALKILSKLRRDRLPDGRLPTIEELLRACEQPQEADPRLLDYLNERPKYRQFHELCLHPERALDDEESDPNFPQPEADNGTAVV